MLQEKADTKENLKVSNGDGCLLLMRKILYTETERCRSRSADCKPSLKTGDLQFVKIFFAVYNGINIFGEASEIT